MQILKIWYNITFFNLFNDNMIISFKFYITSIKKLRENDDFMITSDIEKFSVCIWYQDNLEDHKWNYTKCMYICIVCIMYVCMCKREFSTLSFSLKNLYLKPHTPKLSWLSLKLRISFIYLSVFLSPPYWLIIHSQRFSHKFSFLLSLSDLIFPLIFSQAKHNRLASLCLFYQTTIWYFFLNFSFCIYLLYKFSSHFLLFYFYFNLFLGLINCPGTKRETS